MFRHALVTGFDPSVLLHLRATLGQLRYKVESIPLEQSPAHPFSVAIVDCRPDDQPSQPLGPPGWAIRRVRNLAGRGLVIALGPQQIADEVHEAGADLLLGTPNPDPKTLAALIRQGTDQIARPIDGPMGLILGRSAELLEVISRIKSFANSQATVLIAGETGTGKELVARALHMNSPRADGPFVPINCAAIPESLLESEIFGHARGAFTGAINSHPGRIAAAEGGTLFLDEISELALPMQAKLLRVLQEREYNPVGATKSVKANVRVVAASNRDLQEEVNRGRFRADLYWRLEVITIELPPLRQRMSDVLPISYHIIDRTNHTHRRSVTAIEPAACTRLLSHDWPGNVRELENTIERAVILRSEGPLLCEDIILRQRKPAAMLGGVRLPPDGLDLMEITASLELLLINQALEQTGGNRTQAARLLRINRSTLLDKLRKQGAE